MCVCVCVCVCVSAVDFCFAVPMNSDIAICIYINKIILSFLLSEFVLSS